MFLIPRFDMRAVLVLAVVLTLTACGSSKEAASSGYSISEDESGDVTILLSEDASSETMIAALRDAVDRIKWTPPEAFAGLRQQSVEEIDGNTHAYSYGLQGGGFSVYVYQYGAGVETQVKDTGTSLGMLVDRGRIEAFEQKERTSRMIPWEGGEATLHRILFEETKAGERLDSYIYLLEDGIYWIKVRASFPKGRYTAATVDEMVDALLAENAE